jgi:drug/metabolite transporter (DMT)-like permease
MASSYTSPSFVNFLIAVAIDAGLATLIFRHAHRRGNPHATAWGVFTFLAAVIAIPLYFLNYWFGKARDQHRP